MRAPKPGVDRRTFLLAAAAGCTTVPFGRELVPYVDPPKEWAPGVPTFYASTLVEDGLGLGVLVETHDGRPTKLEGNPRHPATLGSSTAAIQAAILDLYDTGRLREVRRNQLPMGPEVLRQALAQVPRDGVHLALEQTSSAAVAQAIAELRAARPEVRVHVLRGSTGPSDGAALAVGAPRVRRVDLAAADVVVAIDADPLQGPEGIRHARGLADGRRRNRDRRLWVAEAGRTGFGAGADERIALRPSEVPGALVALAAEVLGTQAWPTSAEISRFVARAAADLRARSGVVLVDPTWPAWMHALVLAIDQAVGALGRTVVLQESPLEDLGPDDLGSLLVALDADAVDTLVVLGPNLARGPADLELPRRIRRARQVVTFGLRPDDTSALADWVIPALHPLESWGDARAPDGTRSAVQPVIRPLFAGFQVEDVLGMLAEQDRTAMARAQEALGDDWQRILRLGVAEGTALPGSAMPVDLAAVLAAIPAPPPPAEGLEIRFDRCAKVGDRAHNPWLQEIPDPLTQVAWGNVARLGPGTAAALGVESGDQVRIVRGVSSVELPAIVLPGHPDGLVSVDLGYGADGIGVDVDPIRSADRPWRDDRVQVQPVGRGALVRAQQTLDRQGRDVAREHEDPPEAEPPRLWDAERQHGPQWGMAIDLEACTGCNACAIACQAENNVPVVGPIDVARSRRMHWLRIDRYFDGQQVTFQPMLCQHCQQAPCEYVCPVYASVHGEDGLNEQVYNRCIGTRICSENCPYKVRRFNWFDYGGRRDELQVLQLNPDVTARERGVMEKCTFCVQRLREGQRIARVEGRDVADEDVVPACAQACPSRAITFGRVDRDGPVTELHRDPRAYGELDEELATRPRVRYLARIRNPWVDR